jgi:hypothetical protein
VPIVRRYLSENSLGLILKLLDFDSPGCLRISKTVCELKLGDIETAGGYKLQNVRIYNFDGLLIATIDVKLFDKESQDDLALCTRLELTIGPQKRIFESFDRTDSGGERFMSTFEKLPAEFEAKQDREEAAALMTKVKAIQRRLNRT